MIQTKAAVTAVVLIFEATNDNTLTTGVAMPMLQGFFEGEINCRYIRVRLSSAFAGTGNLVAKVMLSM